MNLRKHLTILGAKGTAAAVRILGKGQGTALPGLVVEKFSNQLLEEFAGQIPCVILITGTNGKTTTQTAITSILQNAGNKVLSNGSGSNMRRGLLSLFVKKSSLRGKIKFDQAVLEIEEATMPRVARELKPKYIVVTNLYRDQLDAYGEIERTRQMIRQAIEAAPQAEVIINADDPQLRDLTKGFPNKVFTYGISPEYLPDFSYEGKGGAGTKADYLADNIIINEDLGSKFKVDGEKFAFNSPGIYNVYNALAAIVVARRQGIKEKDIYEGLQLTKVAFGRGELISRNGITYRLLLAKNPAGLNLVLELLANVRKPKIILMLNDKIADGRDVSWIWDAEFEKRIKIAPAEIFIGGSRAAELLLRLKYVYGSAREVGSGVYHLGDQAKAHLFTKVKDMVKFIEQTEPGAHFYVVPTYTAMLALRKYLLGRSLDEN